MCCNGEHATRGAGERSESASHISRETRRAEFLVHYSQRTRAYGDHEHSNKSRDERAITECPSRPCDAMQREKKRLSCEQHDEIDKRPEGLEPERNGVMRSRESERDVR